MLHDALARLQAGRHHDPFEVLGRHRLDETQDIVRAFLPAAEQVELVGIGPMQRIEGSDLFECVCERDTSAQAHHRLRWQEKGSGHWHEQVSPYSFGPQVGDLDMYWYGQGQHHHAYRFLGSQLREVDGIGGVLFVVWAPAVKRVSVVGDFNAWDGRRHPMRSRGNSGIWELFIPGLAAGDSYKYEILSGHDQLLLKADPYGRLMGLRPETVSRVCPEPAHHWGDSDWLARRCDFDWQHQPISIYELHPGSWQRTDDGGFLSWGELAERLIPYVQELGYTHIELLPVAEHPLDESWGYQVSGYFAPTARYGSPDELRHFVDQCHQAGIGVLLDWVPAHFPKDDFALARFNGEALYEHADPRRGEHQDWGTLIFNYGRHEVRNFLLTNAVYWIEEFHIDGLRVDAVASMLYLDYSRDDGQWLPNEYGGRENLEAIHFLQEFNKLLHGEFPGVLTFAEESTAWPMVTRPTEIGGLGFTMKWNMGWMNDSLSYIEQDPVYRKFHHEQLTFSQMYAYSENFVLPLSHDEVVHLKRSLLAKMPGDYWQQMANLRLFLSWQMLHPGKKLLFMGGEFGQWEEWQVGGQLDWALLDFPAHQGIHQCVADLNRLYRDQPALHQLDFSPDGFQWIDCHDADQSALSFIRRGLDPNETLICILNFTPVVREGYRIGVPVGGDYRELLNTDADCYGGSNCGNAGRLQASDQPWSGLPHSLTLTLPPLAALVLKADR